MLLKNNIRNAIERGIRKSLPTVEVLTKPSEKLELVSSIFFAKSGLIASASNFTY